MADPKLDYVDDPEIVALVDIYEDYYSNYQPLRLTDGVFRRIAELAANLERRGLLDVSAFEREDDEWPVRRVLVQLRQKATRDLAN
jgi:hypothetical protein